MAKAKEKMTEINTLADIPQNMTDDEAAEFFSSHSFGDGLLEQMGTLAEDVLPSPRAATTSRGTASKAFKALVSSDADLMRRLENLARKKGKDYRTLLKEFVLERLYEEEKREGIIR